MGTRGTRATATAAVLGASLLLGACTRGEVDGTASGTPDVTASPAISSPSPEVPAGAASLPGRLLVRDLDGSLVTVRPDGSDRLTLAVSMDGQVEISQAAWAPDGTRVAWGQLDQLEGSVRTQIVMSAPGGGARAETEVPFLPFYLAWDPTSRHVAFLGNQGDGVGLGVVEGANGGAPTSRALDQAQPYYFAWSPAGDRLLIHGGDDRLEELTLEGAASSVEPSPGVFQAPAWTPDGRTQLFVRRGAGLRQTIVARHRARDRSRDLTEILGAGFLVLSPDGRRVAYQALSPDELDLYDRDLPERADDVGVTIVDLETGRQERISSDVAAAWYWSPDGSRLAVLEPVYEGTGPISFRWRVWDGTTDVLTPRFTAALPLLQETTPFFSQYAQSWSMWAPDGSAFAFPLDLPGSPNTIVVQPVGSDLPPYAVGRGTFVAWSPV